MTYVRRLTNRFIQLSRLGALVGLCFVVLNGVADQGSRESCSTDVQFWAAMNKVWVKFSGENERSLLIEAWVAKSPEQRARGFQGVCPDLIKERSLLFYFPVAVKAKFHMTDVVLPLDIAFIDASKQVIGIQRMILQGANVPTRYYRPNSAIEFALETAAGQLDQLKRKPGVWRMRISNRNR